jgi:hypothetical protein
MQKMILTWQERCEIHPDHQDGMVSHEMIKARMQEEIDELRQLFANQKPVAMMFKHDKLGTQFTETCGSAVMNHPKWTPLYEHPMRELTDGEILNIYLEQINGNRDLDILEFARAIMEALKKASEK